jgi:NAD+ synthetase
MFERNEAAVNALMAETRGKTCALVVGHIIKNPRDTGRAAQNVVTILEGGKRVFQQAKTLLPTYDVFDEARYFEPAEKCELWNCDGHRIALAICEDLWARDPALGRRLYGRDPVQQYQEKKADLVLSLSSSPYEWKKRERREAIHTEISRSLGAPLIYVNQVGATDEILFDGASFAVDPKKGFLGRLPIFRTSFGLVDVLNQSAPVWEFPAASDREDNAPEEIAVLARALVAGIRDYFHRTGFKKAVIGLSGGIDSALVAVLAARAIGAENVLGVAMPSQFSSGHSLEDAEQVARKLGIPFEVRPIKFMYSMAQRELSERRGNLSPLALENLQSRLRGVILMTLANHYSALTLTTGNKSELAMGYCTLYGDMAGALAPIGDVLKTRVYQLARYINQDPEWGAPIPERSITKAPSAELKPDQTDQDTLPPYEILDAILEDYIENRSSVGDLQSKYDAELARQTSNAHSVREILKRIELNEYKRRQAAPVLKVSHKAFGIGRRIPIAKFWDQ